MQNGMKISMKRVFWLLVVLFVMILGKLFKTVAYDRQMIASSSYNSRLGYDSGDFKRGTIYDVDGNVTDIESSNHMISIKVDAKDVNNTNLYKTTALSTRQAKEKNIDVANLEWKESIDGVKYCFVSYENKMVLVLEVNGDFADIEHVNTVNLIGYVDDMPKYYVEAN